MHSHTITPQQITSKDEIALNVFLIGFKREVDFRAGQVIGIAVEKDGPRRLYSICSGEKEEEILILFNVVEDGYLTPLLSDLDPGDTIWITEPRGEFTYVEESAFWIATGTGIAPFYSMLRSGNIRNKILIHGERYLERFYFFDEFQEHFGSQYIRCCTAESDQSVYNGRVTDYLRETDVLPLDLKYYLCGRAEMVVEARDILIERNIPFTNIISEIYF